MMTATRERFDVEAERRTLGAMTAGELRRRYQEVGGDEARSRNREYLIRRILWMLQAGVYGGLSERAVALADGLARDFDVRATAPRGRSASEPAPASAPQRDGRLPLPGRAIVRRYKGETLRVTVLADGFEFKGERYGSLSAIAKAVTGSHMNGYRFFGLVKEAA
jgi:hypothetical protein